MAVDVSADGKTLVFDLLGDLYLLPVDGGEAVSLTKGLAWDESPRFSPDGSYVYFLSDRKGYKNVWRLSLSDQSLRQITRSNSDIPGGPNWLSSETSRSRDVLSGLSWSQGGSRLLASVVITTGAYAGVYLDRFQHAIDPIDGTMTPLAGPSGPRVIAGRSARNSTYIFSAAESADGKVYYSKSELLDTGNKALRLFVFDPETRRHTAITPENAAYSDFKPQLSHDGKLLAYFRQYGDRRTEIRLLNRYTAEDSALIDLENSDDAQYSFWADGRPNFAFTPDDQAIIFWHDGKLRRVSTVDGQMNTIPFRATVDIEVAERVRPAVQHLDEKYEAATVRWPNLSRDRQTLVFSSVGYVWTMDLSNGSLRRLSDSNDFEYMPTISPDGTSVAYISFSRSGDEYGRGRLMVADLASGENQELLANPDLDYLFPRWSSDSSKIALIREGDWRKGINPMFGWTSVVDGTFHEVAPDPEVGRAAEFFIYARFVSFDKEGKRLLFSHPRSKTETVLVAAEISTGLSRTLAVATSEIGGIVPSPDLKHLALTRRDGSVWITPFDVSKAPVTVSTHSGSAWRASKNGGYYVDWYETNQLTFGFAKDVYHYSLSSDSNGGDLSSIRIGVPVSKPDAERTVAFTGARLITMSGDSGAGVVIDSGTLVIDGDRIVAVGSAETVTVPEDAVVIDVAGKTIVPGFIDTHYHALGFSAIASPKKHGFADRSAIEFGVTSAWCPAESVDDGLPAIADMQRAGRILAPRWSYAIRPVGGPYELLTDYAAAVAAVERQQDLGSSVLKEYNTRTREQRQWLAAAAREKSVGIVSHLDSFEDIVTRILDGYTGGDHSAIPVPLFDDMAELLRQTGFILTPNLVITDVTVGKWTDQKLFYCNALLGRQEPNLVATAESICGTEYQAPTVDYSTHRISRVGEYVALAASKGASIGVSAHEAPGSLLHQEMWFLWKGGMPVEDVLRAATMTNAEKLGLQSEVGSLETGKMADFLVLDNNPLEQILNTLSLKYTVQGGIVYDSATGERLAIDQGEPAPRVESSGLH